MRTPNEIYNSKSHVYLQNSDFTPNHNYSKDTVMRVVEHGLSICKHCNAAEIETSQYSCEEYSHKMRQLKRDK